MVFEGSLGFVVQGSGAWGLWKSRVPFGGAYGSCYPKPLNPKPLNPQPYIPKP